MCLISNITTYLLTCIIVFMFGHKLIKQMLQVLISKEYLQLEPIGLVFVFFFALILVIQFTAMLFHRFGTLSHILSSTELNWFFTKKVTVGYIQKYTLYVSSTQLILITI